MRLCPARICRVGCYLGVLPRYAGLCLRAAACNSNVDFLGVGLLCRMARPRRTCASREGHEAIGR